MAGGRRPSLLRWALTAVAGVMLVAWGFSLVAFWGAGAGPPRGADIKGPVKLAFTADTGLSSDAASVLQMLAAENPLAVVHAGDLDYVGQPRRMFQMIKRTLGPVIPLIFTLGNAEQQFKDAYLPLVRRQAARSHCAVMDGHFSCRWGAVHVVAIDQPDPAATAFLRLALEEHADAAWRVCVWHEAVHPLHVSRRRHQTTPALWEQLEACRAAGALVINGHDHFYSRSHVLSAVDPPTVADAAGTQVQLGPGRVLMATVGLGGYNMHAFARDAPMREWVARLHPAAVAAAEGARIVQPDEFARLGGGQRMQDMFGALVCTFREEDAGCAFKTVDGRSVDMWVMRH